MRKSFLDSYGDFVKSNPFNRPVETKPDADKLFDTKEDDSFDANLPDVEKNVEQKGLSDEDVKRIAAEIVKLQQTQTSNKEGGEEDGRTDDVD